MKTAADLARQFIVGGLVLALARALAGILVGWLITLGLGLIPIDLGPLNASTPTGISAAATVSMRMTLHARMGMMVTRQALRLTTFGSAPPGVLSGT